MIGKLLLRGLLAGFIAGLLAFGFATVVGEPSVNQAIAIEEHVHAADAGAPVPELVSRETQAGAGLLTALAVYGASVGGLFALIFAFTFRRVGNVNARELSVWIGLAVFVAVVLVPALKYPANPPAVGDPETIAYRTQLFFTMLLVSVVAMGVTAWAGTVWSRRIGSWNAFLTAGALYAAIVILTAVALPSIDEVAADFPPTLLWNFRIAALGLHAVLWTGLTLIFGGVVEYDLRLVTATRPGSTRVSRTQLN